MTDTAAGNVAIAHLIEEQNRRLDKRDDALEKRLSSIETELKATNKHLTRLNGAVGTHGQQIDYLERRDQIKSGKLDDHDGQIAQFMARLAVVESVTEVRDKYQEQGIRNASGDAWAAQQTASDVRTEAVLSMKDTRRVAVQSALIAGVIVLAGLAVFGGILIAVLT